MFVVKEQKSKHKSLSQLVWVRWWKWFSVSLFCKLSQFDFYLLYRCYILKRFVKTFHQNNLQIVHPMPFVNERKVKNEQVGEQSIRPW